MAWLTPGLRKPSSLRPTVQGALGKEGGCDVIGMVDSKMVQTYFTETHCCREQSAKKQGVAQLACL